MSETVETQTLSLVKLDQFQNQIWDQAETRESQVLSGIILKQAKSLYKSGNVLKKDWKSLWRINRDEDLPAGILYFNIQPVNT